MKLKYFLIIGVALFICSFKGDGLIENVYPELLGDYQFYKSVADRSVSFAKDDQNKFTITINKKDQILFYKNGKKDHKMDFVETKMPFENHVLFGKKNDYEPLFYRADTIIVQSFPIPYQDNFFIKKK
jgi:hypothetical protein